MGQSYVLSFRNCIRAARLLLGPYGPQTAGKRSSIVRSTSSPE